MLPKKSTKVLPGSVLLVMCCSFVMAQEINPDTVMDLELDARDRRSIDVGSLLRNLLLNSATASNLKANITRNIVAAKRPLPLPPAPTRRRPKATRAPTTTAPPPPPPPPVKPFLNLFAGSSNFWKIPPPTTTTSTTTTTEENVTLPPLPPPPRQPRPPYGLNRPIYGTDYDYYYPSGYEAFLERGSQSADPLEYDYDDAPTQPRPPPPRRPVVLRKSTRNRQRPVSVNSPPQVLAQPARSAPPPSLRQTTPTPPPSPVPTQAAAPRTPRPQRARVLYEYFQQDDTSSNDNADDEQPRPQPVADTQREQDDNNNNSGQNVDYEGGDNEIPNFENGARPFPDYASRDASFNGQPQAKSPVLYRAQPYYDSDPNRLSSFVPVGNTVSSSYGSHQSSPAKGVYRFRDSFSDFQTTYDGDDIHSGAFVSYT